MSNNLQSGISCDRCGNPVADDLTDRGSTMIAGFYNVAPGSCWAKFARPGEADVCDNCMWADPAYQAVYGTHNNG
jgi:hypothetical protein